MKRAADKGKPGESRGRKATGPRSPPRRFFSENATKGPTTAELPKGLLGVCPFSPATKEVRIRAGSSRPLIAALAAGIARRGPELVARGGWAL